MGDTWEKPRSRTVYGRGLDVLVLVWVCLVASMVVGGAPWLIGWMITGEEPSRWWIALGTAAIAPWVFGRLFPERG